MRGGVQNSTIPEAIHPRCFWMGQKYTGFLLCCYVDPWVCYRNPSGGSIGSDHAFNEWIMGYMCQRPQAQRVKHDIWSMQSDGQGIGCALGIANGHGLTGFGLCDR